MKSFKKEMVVEVVLCGGGGGDGVQSHLKKRAYEGCNFGLPLYPTWIWHTAVCRVNK